MPIELHIKDESATGKILNDILVSFQKELVTVRDIITARVYSEVETYNKRKPEYYNGLVQPTDAEKTLNGFRMKKKTNIDPEKQTYIALEAFKRNGYFILIDNRQAASLDEEIILNKETVVSFVKLTPLVGG